MDYLLKQFQIPGMNLSRSRNNLLKTLIREGVTWSHPLTSKILPLDRSFPVFNQILISTSKLMISEETPTGGKW